MTTHRLVLPSGRPVTIVDDGARGRVYGGNKGRKYETILPRARGRTLVTVGAAGSHHVLATALVARDAGLAARCFVVPQPDVPSAHENLAQAYEAGAELVPVRTAAEVTVRLLAARRDPGNLVVPVGGSSLDGCEAYVQAARELPRARTLVVALGSGGTAAGLAVGAALAGLPWQVHALVVGLLRRHGALRLWPDVVRRLRVVTSELGAGYARSTAASARGLRVAAEQGLVLEPVYTAKAWAHVLSLDAAGETGLAFWQTASHLPLTPGTQWADVPANLRALFRASVGA